ncbi:hypothetical protein BLS_005377 [Venturia inaequalis]|uniref:Integral membrane protein n=1 Tax=Venturia inaequalis TaxID=5025 RepID=A0A8H3Z209_VENIN|nr:hypothetical protein BLS_005377 [Venturia inaequalis]
MDPEINPERLRRLQQRQPLANALILAVSLVLIFPITIVALRMYVRIRIAKKVRTDDFFIILATGIKNEQYISGIFSLAFLAVLASVGRVICYAIVVCGNRKSAAVLWVLLPVSTSFELNFAIVASALPSLSPLFRSAAQRFRGSCGKGDMDMDRESDFIKPAVFYNEQGNLHGKEEWEWQTGKLENINGKAGGGGILVERSYVVERSSNCPCFPSKALFSPRRWAADRQSGKMGSGHGANNALRASASAKGIMKAHPPLPTRMETREPTVEGRRLSFLEVLRQGPPPAMEGRGKGGKVLGA